MSKKAKTSKPAARNRKAAPKAARNGRSGAARTAPRIKVLPSKTTRGAPPPRISRAAFGKGPKPVGRPAAKPAAAKPARARVRICKQENCSNPQTTQGFCRLHYLQNWRALREEKAKRAQKNLDRYVERMAGAKKPAASEDSEEQTEGGQQKEEAVFEEDFGEFVDVLSREENLDKILNGIKVEDY